MTRATDAPEPGPDIRGTADPRRHTEFAATWVTASVAAAATTGPVALRYLDRDLPATSPAAQVLTRLGGLEGRPLLKADVPPPLLALAVADGPRIVLAVANTGLDALDVTLPDGSSARLDGFRSLWRVLPNAG